MSRLTSLCHPVARPSASQTRRLPSFVTDLKELTKPLTYTIKAHDASDMCACKARRDRSLSSPVFHSIRSPYTYRSGHAVCFNLLGHEPVPAAVLVAALTHVVCRWEHRAVGARTSGYNRPRVHRATELMRAAGIQDSRLHPDSTHLASFKIPLEQATLR